MGKKKGRQSTVVSKFIVKLALHASDVAENVSRARGRGRSWGRGLGRGQGRRGFLLNNEK